MCAEEKDTSLISPLFLGCIVCQFHICNVFTPNGHIFCVTQDDHYLDFWYYQFFSAQSHFILYIFSIIIFDICTRFTIWENLAQLIIGRTIFKAALFKNTWGTEAVFCILENGSWGIWELFLIVTAWLVLFVVFSIVCLALNHPMLDIELYVLLLYCYVMYRWSICYCSTSCFHF